MVHIDIAIPTCNRAADVALTLDGLTRLHTPQHITSRVLVVNNCCTDDTSAVVRRFQKMFGDRILEVLADDPGLNHARNAAIEASNADAIAFIDDDVDVEPHWLNALATAFAEGDWAAVGGRAELRYAGPRPEWIGAQEEIDLSRVNLGTERQLCRPDDIFGLNLAIRRSWFNKVGTFRPDLDRSGKSLLSGGETELLRRIADLGGKLVYEPRALLWHRVPQSRTTKRWLLRRQYWGVRSGMRLAAIPKRSALAQLPRAAITLSRATAAYISHGIKSGWDSSAAYNRLRWITDARATMDESWYAVWHN